MLKIFLVSLLILLSINLNAQVYTIGSATHTSTYYGFSSINTLYEDSRVQYIYTASELQAAGVPSGLEIDVFQLFVYELPGVEMGNFTISMKNTTTSSYAGSPIYESGMTTVYNTSSIGPADFTAVDWKQFQLQTPFVWDGVSNLLVQICYDNPDGAAVLNAGGIYVYQDPGNENRTAFRYANLASGCSLTGGFSTRYKANIRLEKNCTAPDISYTIIHSPSICSGNAEMSLSGSEVGVNYKLYDWSATQIGSTISSTGDMFLRATGDDIHMQGPSASEEIRFGLANSTQEVHASDALTVMANTTAYIKSGFAIQLGAGNGIIELGQYSNGADPTSFDQDIRFDVATTDTLKIYP